MKDFADFSAVAKMFVNSMAEIEKVEFLCCATL